MRRLSWFGAGAVAISVAIAGCGGSSSTDSDGSAGSSGNSLAGAAGQALGSAGQAAAGAPAAAGATGLGGSGMGSAGKSGMGSAGQGGMCTAITPCGGSLVGKWQLGDVCLNLTPENTDLGCDGATVSLDAVSLTGSIEFKADLTWTTSADLSFKERVNFPTSCYTQDQCSAFQTALKSENGGASAVCTYDAQSGCSCTISSSQPSTSNGTYEVAGSNVTLTTEGSNNPPETDSFCVSGNTLHLQNTPDAGGISVITATK